MSFGREDADKVYDDLICPALGERGIEAVRVDRLEHNENIDVKMMAGLREAEFVISDLTYARPSVYFEAGFAEARELPVIYTCRRDHLAARADDEYGNFKIHFDLLMRNIIEWTDPGDHIFKSRLGSRVDAILAPMKAADKVSDELRIIREKFADLSSSQRHSVVKDCMASILAAPDFGLKRNTWTNIYDKIFYEKANGDWLECFTATVRPDGHASSVHFDQVDLNVDRILTRLTLIKEHNILCSFDPVSLKEVAPSSFKVNKTSSQPMMSVVENRTIPILPYQSEGPVFHPVFGRTFFGRGVDEGACVRDAPAHLTSSEPRFGYQNQGLRVVNCTTRKIPLLRTYQVVESIKSIEEFRGAFRSCISAALEIGLSEN